MSAPGAGARPAHRWPTWLLFALCVAVWGSTWHVITWQLQDTPPALAVALRFGLAGVLVLAGCALRGTPLRFSAAQHGLLALQGVFMYALSYVCIYQAERHVPSGLVAVGYSASPLINGLAARALWGVPMPRRFLAGGALGLGGVALIFAPEFGRASAGPAVALGAAFTVASVLLSSVGSLTASRNRTLGLPLWPALGWGMVYGALAAVAVLAFDAVPGGAALPLPPSPLAAPAWWAALLYLAVAGSVLSFAAFLTLQDRVGPGPASAVGVAAPVLAIAVSVALEGLRPGWETAAGVTLAVLGNGWMLRR